MSENVRHRMVHAISLTLLQKEVEKLREQGWVAEGEPSLAAPMDLTRPPYWVQAMYLNAERPGDSSHPSTGSDKK
jgi:hypothetical protein